jgi:hypothetical protein
MCPVHPWWKLSAAQSLLHRLELAVVQGLQTDRDSRPISNLFKGEPLTTLWRQAKAADADLKALTWCEERRHLFKLHALEKSFVVNLRLADDQRVHVTNVNPATTADDLQRRFSQFGDICLCRVYVKPLTVTALIGYADAKSALKAVSCPNISLDGRQLTVTKCNTSTSRRSAQPTEPSSLDEPLSSKSLVHDVTAALRRCASRTMSISQLGELFSQRLPAGERITPWCTARSEILELLPATSARDCRKVGYVQLRDVNGGKGAKCAPKCGECGGAVNRMEHGANRGGWHRLCPGCFSASPSSRLGCPETVLGAQEVFTFVNLYGE